MKIGVTGHQSIGSDETIKWVTSSLEKFVDHTNIELGITSLAIGADQLFAQVLKEHNIPFAVVVPSIHYEQTFKTSTDLEIYKNLLNFANHKLELPFNEPSEIAFYEAGKKIVDLSDMIIAIWNGKPAEGLGGTGDIVKYALFINRSILHINPITKTVKSYSFENKS